MYFPAFIFILHVLKVVCLLSFIVYMQNHPSGNDVALDWIRSHRCHLQGMSGSAVRTGQVQVCTRFTHTQRTFLNILCRDVYLCSPFSCFLFWMLKSWLFQKPLSFLSLSDSISSCQSCILEVLAGCLSLRLLSQRSLPCPTHQLLLSWSEAY